ncbi:30S ribosomal protein S9 [bacterium]|nr:30S ribosomal protein S9 [bacterium]
MEKVEKKEKNPFEGRKYIRGLGRRKSSSAVAQLYVRGKGQFVVNKKDVSDYFSRADLIDMARLAMQKIEDKNYDINVRVSGGGEKGQAQAVSLAVARALLKHDADLRPVLRGAGLITVDRRVKERKKPGLKRARRAPQWSKR